MTQRHSARSGLATMTRLERRTPSAGVSRVAVGMLCALATATVAPPALAQVNTENLRKRVKVTGATVLVEGTLSGDAGNTEGITVGAGLGGGWGRGRHLAFAYGRIDYARYNEATSINKSFAHARYVYELLPWLWAEAFAQAQSDQFQRMTLRNLFGAGPRVLVVHATLGDAPVPGGDPHRGDLDVYFGVAYMLERDVVNVAPGASDASLQVWHRLSSYLTAQWEIDDRAILATTIYAQPALDDPRNVRVLDETLLTFKVTKILTASVAGTVHYDSAPPTAVKTTDVEIKNALGLTF